MKLSSVDSKISYVVFGASRVFASVRIHAHQRAEVAAFFRSPKRASMGREMRDNE
jgi:hypothetical protein